MIAEHMDESLVMLKDLLCWPLMDLTYLRQNQRMEGSRSNMTEETRSVLGPILYKLYSSGYLHAANLFQIRKNKAYLKIAVYLTGLPIYDYLNP